MALSDRKNSQQFVFLFFLPSFELVHKKREGGVGTGERRSRRGERLANVYARTKHAWMSRLQFFDAQSLDKNLSSILSCLRLVYGLPPEHQARRHARHAVLLASRSHELLP